MADSEVSYLSSKLFIAGKWCDGADGQTLPVVNPATEMEIGRVAKAGAADLERAIAAATRGFETWRRMPAFDRAQIMLKAAALLRERSATVGRHLTMEQGKTLDQGIFEVNRAAGELEWAAGEAMRTYGRVIPARNAAHQAALRQPIGPVALFTPWNFPINQLMRKVAPALAAGCSIVAKPPEETPAAPSALARALQDAGLPDGVINIVFGVPAEISEYMIRHPDIRKISFTGSVAVGKHLAAMAGQYMKRATMELGGHAPVLVFEDADLDYAVERFAGMKIFNAGQTCATPNRFVVHDRVYEEFSARLADRLGQYKVGDGLEDGVQVGALANERRLDAMMHFVSDAKARGGRVTVGGDRVGNRGYFFPPTIIADAPADAAIRTVEAFGPVAALTRFSSYDDAIAEANRLPYGLVAYALTNSSKTINKLMTDVECGSLIVNEAMIGLAEVPFGGVKDSGYGTEGGSEGTDSYLTTKLVHVA